MKTLRNLTLAILAAGTMAACSTTRTGTGSGGTSGTSGSGSDSASTGTSGTTRDTTTSGSGTSGVGGNTSGALTTGSSIGNYAGSTEVSGSTTNSTVNATGSVTSTASANGSAEGATGISGTQGAGAGSSTTLSGSGSNSISGATPNDKSLNGNNSNSTSVFGKSTTTRNSSGYADKQTSNAAARNSWSPSMADTTSASGFISTAARSGMKEVELSRLAQTKASNPEVRSFAMMMVKDHSMQHQQLASLARTKRVSMPGAMTAVGAGSNTMGTMSGTGTIGNQKSGNTGKMDPGRGNTGVTGNQNMGNTGSATDNMGNNTTTDQAAQNMATTDRHDMSSMGSTNNGPNSSMVNSLQNLSGAEFDRQYMQMMVQDHEQAVNLFTSASQSNDAQIRAFAMKSLPKLRAHLYDAKQISNRLTR